MRPDELTFRGILLGTLLALGGCEPGLVSDVEVPGLDEEDEPQAPLPADTCNTKVDATSVIACSLKLGVIRSEFIGLPGDQDWYEVKLPAGLTARSLLHVNAGYAAPNTAVNLQVNVMRADGTSSIAMGVDKHGQAAPRPVDLIAPFSDSGATVLVLVADASGSSRQSYDSKAPYTLKVEIIDNPDLNEPNDVTPTPVPLTTSGDRLAGTQKGYLATSGDVDRFSLQLPAGRKVAYLHLSGPKLMPPTPFRLSYTVLDPTGKAFAEGRMDNEFLAVDLATARITEGGTYTVVVQGYTGVSTQPVPGDLRLEYTLEVQVMSEADTNEPNDTFDTATNTSFSAPGGSANLIGRIDHVPDAEWFSFTLAPSGSPTVLYYHVTPGSAGGRFPPLPGSKDRQVRVFTVVTQGATAAERSQACRTSSSVCPRRPDMSDDFTNGLVDSFCGMSPARCLTSSREEELEFAGLHNFEGAIPVPAHGAPVKYYLLYGDDGNNFADDKDFTLKVEWRADDDEASRTSGGQEQTVVKAMAVDDAASGFPVPPSGAAYELSGKLSYGYGFYRNNDPNRGDGVRGPRDYDGFASDTDSYQLDFPAGLAAPLDRTWELQWEVDKAGGRAPYDLILEVTLCDGSGSPGSCQRVTRELGYKGGDLGSWHSTGIEGITRQPVYSRSDTAGNTQVTALAWGCFCFERRFIQGGKFFINVIGVDRESYAEAPYRIRTALTSYPKAYNGGQCPAVVPTATGFDKGCEFTHQ
ncbi:MAG: cell-cell cohesion protein MtsF [Myxococcaceae bacterium]